MARILMAAVLGLLVSPVLAGDQAVLIDHSGSMRPYYAQGLISTLASRLQRVAQESMSGAGRLQTFLFDSELAPVSSLQMLDGPPTGKYTMLDKALQYPITNGHAIAWMITDNVQDEPGSLQVGNTEVFYRQLQSDSVKKVVIFPVLQSAGTQGLVIYALLLSSADDEAFERAVEEFPGRVQDVCQTEAFRMKPLDLHTIDVLMAGAAAEGGPPRVFQEGTSIRESVELRFRSRLEHLKIENAAVDVSEARPSFDEASLLRTEHQKVSVSPAIVRSLDAHGETEQMFQISVDLGRVSLKRDLTSLWKAAFERSGENVLLALPILIHIPRENFRLRENFARRYAASTLEAARVSGRIYGLERIPLLVASPVTRVRLEAPLSFHVKYPWWPFLIWLVLLGGGGFAVVAIARAAVMAAERRRRAPRWSVEAFGQQGPLECSHEDGILRLCGARSEDAAALGVLEGDRFTPADGVNADGRAGEPVAITAERGIPLVLSDGRQLTLMFRKGSARRSRPERAKSDEDAYTPQER